MSDFLKLRTLFQNFFLLRAAYRGKPRGLNPPPAFYVTWAEGTVLPEDADASGMGASEHMAAFDYAYKFSAIRDWLFAQSKG